MNAPALKLVTDDGEKPPIEWHVFNGDAPASEHPYFNKSYVVDLRRSGVHPENDGYIYFIADEDRTVVKIGRAKDPWNRLRDTRTGNHLNLQMVFCFRADMNAERLFHKKFEDRRIRGEWFRYTFDLDAFEDDDFDFRFRHAIGKDEPLNIAQVTFLLDVLRCDDDDFYLTKFFEYLESEKARGVPVDNQWITP